MANLPAAVPSSSARSSPLHRRTVDFRRRASRALPNTTLFAVPGLKAETSVMALDLDGVAVSSGSACSSGKVAASPVLAAMGVPAELAGGRHSRQPWADDDPAELDLFLNAWKKRVAGLSKERNAV